jgi:hypothetical protein
MYRLTDDQIMDLLYDVLREYIQRLPKDVAAVVSSLPSDIDHYAVDAVMGNIPADFEKEAS